MLLNLKNIYINDPTNTHCKHYYLDPFVKPRHKMCHLNKIVTNSHVATIHVATKIAIGFFLCTSSLPLPKFKKKI